ncbi:hypothetical protein LCGC14_0410890 [marine sediment metagenome]|uniref:Uncharacterized protein n=1 Tax=marine sediment metagenome TaxID=412755 RepID=A0A0F9W2W0_9ZZZZ
MRHNNFSSLEEEALSLMAQGWMYVDLPKDLQRALEDRS